MSTPNEPEGWEQPPAGEQPPQAPPPLYGQQPPQMPPSPQAPPPLYGQQPPQMPRPPQAPPPQVPSYGMPPGMPPSGPIQRFGPVPVSIGDAFRYAWEAFKGNPTPWLVAALIGSVIGGIGEALESVLRRDTVIMDVVVSRGTPASELVNLVFTVIGYVLAAAFIQVALRVTDGRRVALTDFTAIPNLAQAVLAAVILGVAVTVGLWMLVIPGIIIQVLGTWYLHLALDQRLAAIDALKGSVQMVTQNLGTTILFGLAAAGVALLGVLALFVGLFVAIPLIVIASAFVFRRLTGGQVMVPGSA